MFPHDFYLREIAIQTFENNTYIRHLSFSSSSELRKHIISIIPRHLYYSSARYREPANINMDEKKWIGSDLVFDIDANEIIECRESNKYIQIKFCEKCGYSVQQINVKTCPQCGLELIKFEHVEPECIDTAKEHVIKLIDILENDFGFGNLFIAFSGHRGFHVVAELNEHYSLITADDRREIVSYIRIDEQQLKMLINQIIKKSKKHVMLPPRVVDGGIRRRIAMYLSKHLDEEIKSYVMGLRPAISFETAQKVYDYLMQHISDVVKVITVAIDTKVTIDITHLIRVPNSLNGKTGWKAVCINNADIYSFELAPHILSSADPTLKMKIKFLTTIPHITVIDREFKYRKGDEIILDYPYASYFLYKDLASVIDIIK